MKYLSHEIQDWSTSWGEAQTWRWESITLAGEGILAELAEDILGKSFWKWGDLGSEWGNFEKFKEVPKWFVDEISLSAIL